MSETEKGLSKVTLRMAWVWATLFSVNGLCSCILVGLSNATWTGMTNQGRFLLFVGILMNWTGLMMAFVSKTFARLEAGKTILDTGDTTQWSRSESSQQFQTLPATGQAQTTSQTFTAITETKTTDPKTP